MKESYTKGLANRDGPESCGSVRKGDGEALTGVRAGWVLSREMNLVRDADSPLGGKQFRQAPNVIGYTSFHRGSHPQTGMHSTEVMIGKEDR